MKNLYFILIPTAFDNALAVAESFKSKEFNDLKEISEAVHKTLKEEDEEYEKYEEEEEILVMSVSAFTDFYNESISASEYFITPVYVV